MAKTTAALLPTTAERLRAFGERLRLARLRRRLAAKQVAQRSGMSPMTLRSVERGGPGVTLGAYVSVMQVLGVEIDIDRLCQADPLGRELQDARLPAPRQAPLAAHAPMSPHATNATASAKPRARQKIGWQPDAVFATSQALASLIQAPPRAAKKARRR